MSVDFSVNGELYSMPKGSSLADLITELEVNNIPVTIKINRKTIMRGAWHQEIQAEDRIEIARSIPNSCFTGTHE